MQSPPRLIPELNVSDLDRSLGVYVDVFGFTIARGRPDERFAYLEMDGIHLMLEEAAGPGRRFHTAALEPPFGRGMNLQIEIPDVDATLQRAEVAGLNIVVPIEERWYRAGDQELGNRQFVVADPDGYLLRFFTNLGSRVARPAA